MSDERAAGAKGRLLSGILLAAVGAAGPGVQPSAAEGLASSEGREVDELLVLSLTAGVTRDHFAPRFELGKGQPVAEGFSLARRIAYPAVDPASVITRAVIALRPGPDDRVATARFIIAKQDPADCTSTRAFADRHGLLVAAPMHPEDQATPTHAGRTRYLARFETAQVSATSHPHSDCLQELHVWYRHTD